MELKYGTRRAVSVYPITTIVKCRLALSAIIEKVSPPAVAMETRRAVTQWNKAYGRFTGIPVRVRADGGR